MGFTGSFIFFPFRNCCTESVAMKTTVIMVMLGSFVQSSPVQTSELANEDTQFACSAEEVTRCNKVLAAAAGTCTALMGVSLDPHSACAWAACVSIQVGYVDTKCVRCVCEWIAGNRPRDGVQCDYCETCEEDADICEGFLTFNATVPFPNMIAN